MTASVKVTVEARKDLSEIARYSEQMWGRKKRNLYLKLIESTFERIANHPSIGQECNLIRPGYLFFPAGSHLLFYRIADGDVVEIIRILHKSMYVMSRF